ncbi:Asp23/Gls24 family envelope stress response protein [Cellulomonas cellasea]|uniref:Asp23/Gls24 family envelope stress response protein n=1 Tax=Cellulomonas cellasea TaxID=43670 RepID=UPI0025A359DF|nr:Asp23/Gls24 family envelope stress response protein [Cellulomonas cellasea]MDM8084597.1 Asp23/Gls24 family envelope stress response protein [Cellulomonas cellasea]
MSEQSGSSTPSTSGGSGTSRQHSALDSAQGSTTIADGVVATIAGLAAKEIQGVHGLGGGAARTVGALRERIPGARPNYSQGVSVEVGDHQASVDLEVIIEYGVPLADVASAIRRNVINAVERMTGLHVTQVDISVVDIHLPEDDTEGDDSGSSGQAQRSS